MYLLHGYGGDHTDWVRLGNAAFNADSLIAEGVIPPVILVMLDGKNSWYVNSDPVSGFGAYEAAIVEDDDVAWIYQGSVDFHTSLKGEELSGGAPGHRRSPRLGVWDAGAAETLVFFSEVFRSRYG